MQLPAMSIKVPDRDAEQARSIQMKFGQMRNQMLQRQMDDQDQTRQLMANLYQAQGHQNAMQPPQQNAMAAPPQQVAEGPPPAMNAMGPQQDIMNANEATGMGPMPGPTPEGAQFLNGPGPMQEPPMSAVPQAPQGQPPMPQSRGAQDITRLPSFQALYAHNPEKAMAIAEGLGKLSTYQAAQTARQTEPLLKGLLSIQQIAQTQGPQVAAQAYQQMRQQLSQSGQDMSGVDEQYTPQGVEGEIAELSTLKDYNAHLTRNKGKDAKRYKYWHEPSNSMKHGTWEDAKGQGTEDPRGGSGSGTTDIKNYNYARQHDGFKGSFQKWLKEGKKSPTGMNEKIRLLTETGVPEDVAKGLVAGRYVVSRHPTTQVAQVVDKATGQVVFDGNATPAPTPDTPIAETPPPMDAAEGTGMSSVYDSVINRGYDFFGGDLPYPKAEEAAQKLTNLKMRTQTAMQDAVPGRPSKYLMELLAKATVEPNSVFQGDARAKVRLTETRDMLRKEMKRMDRDILGNPGLFTPKQIADTRASRSQVAGLLTDYNDILKGFGGGKNKQGEKATKKERDEIDAELSR